VSRDLSWAEVYVSTFKPEGNLSRGVLGLQSAAGFIQSQLAAVMRIRKTPRLRFYEDTSIREGFELVQKIDGLVVNSNGVETADAEKTELNEQ
jgi:ribosome-binding factor A